jgi:hypothetical protein
VDKFTVSTIETVKFPEDCESVLPLSMDGTRGVMYTGKGDIAGENRLLPTLFLVATYTVYSLFDKSFK